MYCIVVKNEVKPGSRDAYLAAMLPNAKASVDKEPGCIAFDVLEAREEENTFYLYELYTDTAALQAHKETEHYLSSRPLLSEIVVATSVIRADVIERNPA